MARIRTIKPDFWTDEKVVELSAFARLLFIGLWNFCDDDGRMVCSPKKIKMQIFPADSVDCSELLGEIRRASLISVYVVDGVEFLQVLGFEKHQKIDKRSASKLPPPENPAESPRIPPTEWNGMEGRVLEPTALVASKKPATALPSCPVEQVVEVYHDVLPELPRVRLMTDKRRRCIGQTWRWVLTSKKPDGTPRADTADGAILWMRSFFEQARKNDFLMGRGKRGDGHEGWVCDLDFLLSEKGMKHVIEKTGDRA
jgi:hypothetical protein